MVFVQKLGADGSVLASALIADAGLGYYAAKVDSTGSIYIAVAARAVAGVSGWGAAGTGYSGVVKVAPQLDRVLYATHVFDFAFGQMSLDLDSDGSAVVGLVNYDNARIVKLDPAGALTSFSYFLTDTPARGGGTAYDAHWIGVAVAPDHSVTVAVSPMFLYRIDSSGKQTISRASVGDGKILLSALCLDRMGNAYVAANVPSQIPIPATAIDYENTAPRTRSMVMKFDPAGTNVFTTAFATSKITALTTDGSSAIWGAGANTGVGVFQLNASGTSFLHYVTVPADSSAVYGLSLDSTGRPLVAGSTASFQLPDTGPPRVSDGGPGGDWNAFFLRIKSNPTQANLKVSLTSLASVVPTFGNVTYQATITNIGSGAADDVRIVPAVSTGRLFSCQATGNGECRGNAIVYASLAPGASQQVQFRVSIPSPAPSPFSVSLSAATSTDDPDQLNNNAYTEVAVQTAYLAIQTTVQQVTLQLDNSVGTWAVGPFTNHIFTNPGVPTVPGSTVNVFVPGPQVVFDAVYAFAGWGDGSLENPRSFTPQTTGQALTLNMRLVTEPWVNPDAPVQHAGSYRGGAIAPGEIVTLFGYNLGPSTLQTAALDETGRIATKLGGFSVLFNGVPAPVVYASARQSSAIVPYSVAGRKTVEMAIQYNGLNSTPVTVAVTDSVPGLLTANYAGSGQVLAFNSDGSLNSRTSPIQSGDILVLYGSGEGLTDALPPDGAIAGPSPPKPRAPVSVTIGGQPAEVLYSGGVGGVTAGLLQLNVRVPANTPQGLLPVLLTVGTNTSQREATIAIR